MMRLEEILKAGC